MKLIAWIVDILVLLLIVRLVSRFVGGMVTRRRGPSPRPTSPERVGGTLVRDPQCGTYVPESRAVHLVAGNKTLYFCSVACRDTYAAAAGLSNRAGRKQA